MCVTYVYRYRPSSPNTKPFKPRCPGPISAVLMMSFPSCAIGLRGVGFGACMDAQCFGVSWFLLYRGRLLRRKFDVQGAVRVLGKTVPRFKDIWSGHVRAANMAAAEEPEGGSLYAWCKCYVLERRRLVFDVFEARMARLAIMEVPHRPLNEKKLDFRSPNNVTQAKS